MSEPEEKEKESQSPEAEKESLEGTEEAKTILENWEELKELPLQDYFSKGWRPLKKRQKYGLMIYLRKQWRDQDGWKEATKSLGPYDEGRWRLLLEMFPHKINPTSTESESLNSETESLGTRESLSQPRITKGSSVLGTRIAKPLPATVHLDLETLQWYQWLQQNTDYKGTLDKFLNEAVKGYFREYQKLELAIIIQRD